MCKEFCSWNAPIMWLLANALKEEAKRRAVKMERKMGKMLRVLEIFENKRQLGFLQAVLNLLRLHAVGMQSPSKGPLAQSCLIAECQQPYLMFSSFTLVEEFHRCYQPPWAHQHDLLPSLMASSHYFDGVVGNIIIVGFIMQKYWWRNHTRNFNIENCYSFSFSFLLSLLFLLQYCLWRSLNNANSEVVNKISWKMMYS